MQLQSLLRRLYPQPGFVYRAAKFVETRGRLTGIEVTLVARKGAKPVCSGCYRKRSPYDRLSERRFTMVPLWALNVTFLYSMRRVDCRTCGVRVEAIPWADGKSTSTHAFVWFLSSWAKLLSWKETAKRFQTSWDIVYRSVQHAVRWGLENRSLEGIRAIGVDELAWKKGHKYMTLVYQLDHGLKRLLFIGKDRTASTFNDFFDLLGEERSKALEFIASDLWKAFLRVARERASKAIHFLDRFHVAQLLSRAVDVVRREEVRSLRKQGKAPVLTKSRWLLLKRPNRLSPHQGAQLQELLKINLRTTRAYLLKESLQRFWGYVSPTWAGRFLDAWTTMAMRSKLEPFKKFARTLRAHRHLVLNWFRARSKLSLGAVEGFNNKARITTRKAYGFRTFHVLETALYHALGDLPEPDFLTHKFL